MDSNIIESMDIVSRFCRLQMNIKKDLPIRASEMGVLIYVERNGIQTTPLTISNYFGIAKPSATDMINSLVEKNYLAKLPSTADRRSYTLTVTEKGHELVESTYKEYFRSMELLEEKMGYQDFKQFIQLLQQANKILSGE